MPRITSSGCTTSEHDQDWKGGDVADGSSEKGSPHVSDQCPYGEGNSGINDQQVQRNPPHPKSKERGCRRLPCPQFQLPNLPHHYDQRRKKGRERSRQHQRSRSIGSIKNPWYRPKRKDYAQCQCALPYGILTSKEAIDGGSPGYSKDEHIDGYKTCHSGTSFPDTRRNRRSGARPASAIKSENDD